MGISDPSLSRYSPILLVDSDQQAAERLANYLREHGFHADIATSCWSAEAAMQKSTYGTLVVAANLKQAADRECLCALRRDAPRTWIIVISLSPYPDAQEVVFRCDADSLLVAPFSLTELCGRLSAFARRSRPPHMC